VNAAEELRAAAAKLRNAAAPAECLDEWADFYATDEDVPEADRPWIALLSPALAEPLALWLEEVAEKAGRTASLFVAVDPEQGPPPVGATPQLASALGVARVINGGAS